MTPKQALSHYNLTPKVITIYLNNKTNCLSVHPSKDNALKVLLCFIARRSLDAATSTGSLYTMLVDHVV